MDVYNKMNKHLSRQAVELKKTTTYGVINPGLGQSQKCGGVKPDNKIRTPY
jgi:hypothetical protein